MSENKLNYLSSQHKKYNNKTNLKTFKTRIVAGELTTESFRFVDFRIGGSSRGLLDADVAIANAAAAVDVLLLNKCDFFF